ncbi:TetR/AcrR family transcriptional regulator [Pediococcus siamensis]|uniref:TetR/AcrR family transcriptional regulator n=1 Tax=Pediococcus siamensis TaxID=381829 RepID=UPI00399F958F
METSIFTNYKDWLNKQKMPNGQRAVLQSALDLFARQGYDGTATAEIAKHAGVSQGTIFKYFKTKQDLLLAIMMPMIGNLFPVIRNDFFNKLNEYNGLEELVHFVVQDRYKFLKENADAIQILLTEVMVNKEIQSRFLGLLKASRPVFDQSSLNRIVKLHLIRPGLTLVDFARTIIGQLLSYFLQRNLMPEVPTNETEDLKKIEQLVIHAVRP